MITIRDTNVMSLINKVWPNREIQKNGEEILVLCPFCASDKQKLSVNVDKKLFQCWVCGEKGTVSRLFRYLRRQGIVSDRDVKAALSGVGGVVGAAVARNAKTVPEKERLWDDITPCVFPRGTVVYADMPDGAAKRHVEMYMGNRGMNETDIIDYDIRVLFEMDSVYNGHIFFPVYGEDCRQVIFWTTRSTLGTTPKSLHSGSKYSKYTAKQVLFNWHKIRSGYPMAICEGPFDAMSVTKHAFPAVSLLGKVLHSDQLNAIKKAGPSKVYICLDADAVKESLRIEGEMVANSIPSCRVELWGKDPNEMDPVMLKKNIRFSEGNTSDLVQGAYAFYRSVAAKI